MWKVWHPVTHDSTIVDDRAEADRLARERGARVLPADSCGHCGGEKDADGECAYRCLACLAEG